MPVRSESLAAFFHEQIVKAQRHQKLPLREDTQFYVVQLLSDFADPERLFGTLPGGEEDEPIALMFARALQTPNPADQIHLFRIIGDRTLYVSGFFSDFFRRKLVDVDYYISLGENAYGSARILSPRDFFNEVFEELSRKFERLVGVLSEVSEASGVTSDRDLLRLYERWLATRDERLTERLRSEGILPVGAGKGPLH